MYGNSANINKLCEFIGLKYDQEIEWGFFAGTMFWFRPAVYETLAEKIREINFGREEGKQDGGVEHAIERMFGLIPSYFKKKGLLIYPKDDSNKLGKKEKIVLPGKPDTVDPTKKLNSFAKKILQKNNIVGDVNKQSVGALADMKVRGWIAKLNDASPRCFVLRIGNEEIEGVAVHYRGDLEDHGINNGCHAFEVPAPLKFANGKDVEITLFDKSTGMPVATAKYKWSSVSRSYSDFNSYLTWSYTGHYVQVPFVEADKRAFAVMELIADDLQRISSNSFDYPLISIIMPTYNRGSLISDAIDSVLNQTYFNWELIIVDDASSDDSRGVVSRYADGRVKYYRLDENGGVSRARNYGLQKAKGEFIAYLDSDNSWDERYLSAIHGAIKNINSNVNALYTGQIVFKGKNKDIEGVRFGMYNKSLLLNNNYIDLNCFVHKKTIEGFDLKFNESIPRFVDWEFIARMSLVSPIYSVPVLLSYYNLELADNAITSNAKYFSHYEGVQTMITNMAKSVRNENNFSVGEVKDRGISVVIPSFNAAQDLKDCLDSLKSYMTRSNFEVIIVDNNSADEAISVINEFCSDFPKNSSFISLDRNFGYTFAVNKGLNSVKFKNDVLLLNNDAVVVGNALDVMQNILHSDDSYGISAPAQILPGNTETITTHVPYAVPETEVDVNISAHHKNLSVGELFYSGGPIKVDFVPFFCVLIKREVLDVAPNLDHRNGRHYRSDRTYCSYIKAMHDFSVVMVPDAIIYHKLQKSTKELNKYSKLADDYSFILKENAWMESEQIEGGFKVAIWNKSF